MLMNELSMILLMKLGIGVRIKETIFRASILLKFV